MWSLEIRISNIEIRNKSEFSEFKIPKLFCLKHLKFGHLRMFRVSDFVLRILTRLSGNNLATAGLPFCTQFYS